MRKGKRALRVLALLFILGAISLPAPLNVACHVCMFLTVFGLTAVHRSYPFHALPALARAVATQRRAIEGRAQAIEVLIQALLPIGGFILGTLLASVVISVIFFLIMLSFTLFPLLFPVPDTNLEPIQWIFQQVWTVPIIFLATMAAAWVTGRIIGNSRITRSRMFLKRMTDEIEAILAMQQEK